MPPARPHSGRPRPASAEEEPLFDAAAAAALPAVRPRARLASAPSAGAAGLDSSTTPLRGGGLAPIESSGPRAFATYGSEGGDVTLDVRQAGSAPKGGAKGGRASAPSSSDGAASASAASSRSTARPPPAVVDTSAATQKRALPSLPRALIQWWRVARLWYLS